MFLEISKPHLSNGNGPNMLMFIDKILDIFNVTQDQCFILRPNNPELSFEIIRNLSILSIGLFTCVHGVELYLSF